MGSYGKSWGRPFNDHHHACFLSGRSTDSNWNIPILARCIALWMHYLFTLVTLPVEFDASKRALASLKQGNYVTEKELNGAEKVLNAAAMTYVAAFITSLVTLFTGLSD